MPDISVGFKIWFNIRIGQELIPFLGEQKIDLLRQIQDTGSISEAAKQVGMDYHKAWDMIDSIHEKIEPHQLVVTTRGRNGGASLTPISHMLLEEYDSIREFLSHEIRNNAHIEQ